MSAVPTLAGFTACLVDNHTLEVEVTRDTSINTLFAALSAQNIQVRSLRNKTNRLEELFIRLVGNKESAA